MFQIVKRHLFHRKTEQKHALLCDADAPNGIHPHNLRPSGTRKVFTCLNKTTLKTTHEPQGKDVDWIQKQLDVSEELEWASERSLPTPVKNENLPGEFMSTSMSTMRSEITSDTGVRADTPSTYQTRRRQVDASVCACIK